MNPILKRSIINIVEDGVFDTITDIDQLNNIIINYGNSFKNKIENSAFFDSRTKIISDLIDDQYNNNVGIAFEVFVACLFTLRGDSFDMIYCKDFLPSEIEEVDEGIDAYAKSIDPEVISRGDDRVAIQIKFSKDADHLFTRGDLDSFCVLANNHNISYENMIFVNYGAGVSNSVERVYTKNGRSMRVISRKDIQRLLAKPGSFFDDMRDLLKLSYDHVVKLKNEEKNNSNTWKIRSFQKEIIDDAISVINSNENKATYIMPTGAGKTLTAMKIMDYKMSNSKNASFVVVCVPTILLSSQYSKDVSSYYGNSVDIMRVCSDRDRNEHSINEDVTLFPQDIMARIVSSVMSKKDTVIITTYASYDKVFSSFIKLNIKVDLCIMDEAHHIISGRDSKHDDANWNVRKKIEDESIYDTLFNFTATPVFDETIVDAKGNIATWENFPKGLFASASMNNPTYFGRMKTITLNAVLDEGYVTPVKLWVVKTGNNFDKITSSTVKSIIDKHCDMMDRMNIKNEVEMIRPTPEEVMSHLFILQETKKIIHESQYVKLVFSTPSTGYAHILNHTIKEIIPMLAEAGYEFFEEDIYIDSMSSDSKHMAHWSNLKKRDIIIDEIKKDKHSIIYHYDMLSEGVNIPSISGVGICRPMSELKSIQVIGRGIRSTPNDILMNNKAHAEGDPTRYSPSNMENRIKDLEKPYSLCIIPVSGSTEEIKNQLTHFIENLYNGNREYAFSGLEYSIAGSVEDNEDKTIERKEIIDFIYEKVDHLPSFTIEEKIFDFVDKKDVKKISDATEINVDELANKILGDAAPQLLTISSGSSTLVYLDASNYNLTDTSLMFTIIKKIKENDRIVASLTMEDDLYKFVISYR